MTRPALLALLALLFVAGACQTGGPPEPSREAEDGATGESATGELQFLPEPHTTFVYTETPEDEASEQAPDAPQP